MHEEAIETSAPNYASGPTHGVAKGQYTYMKPRNDPRRKAPYVSGTWEANAAKRAASDAASDPGEEVSMADGTEETWAGGSQCRYYVCTDPC